MLVNYCDVDVYERDAALYRDGQWLNDTCINLRFRRIEQMHEKLTVFLLDPSVVSFMRFQMDEKEEIEELAEGIGLNLMQWIVVPLNDSGSLTSASTHWSLLLCHRASGGLFHFDSNKGYNNSAAGSTSDKIALLIGR